MVETGKLDLKAAKLRWQLLFLSGSNQLKHSQKCDDDLHAIPGFGYDFSESNFSQSFQFVSDQFDLVVYRNGNRGNDL